MIKVVLDTNIVVSALLKPDSNPEVVLNLFLEHNIVTAYISDDIFAEYKTVLSYGKFKKYLDQKNIQKVLAVIEKKGKKVKKVADVPSLEDPDDTKFLACAVAAKVDFIITGNLKHFPKKYGDVSIVSPAKFVRLMGEVFLT